jgi:hypothetical protein
MHVRVSRQVIDREGFAFISTMDRPGCDFIGTKPIVYPIC